MSEARDGKARSARPATRAGDAARDDPPPPVCELCGGTAFERHCKILCLNCGYQRDCSDP